MNKQDASEYPKITVQVSTDMPPKHGGMTSVARFTATCAEAGKKLTLGHALLCVPTEASQASQGCLVLDIDTNAADMDEVAVAILNEIRDLAIKGKLEIKSNMDIAFKYDGNLANKLKGVKKFSDDGLFLFSMGPALQSA